MNRTEKALEIFKTNFNCAQSVFTAFAPDLGVDELLALKLTTMLGTGAKCGNVCGAVSGALLILGLKNGHYIESDPDQKSKANEIASEFINRFKEKNGSALCSELLGRNPMIPENRAWLKENGVMDAVCPKAVKTASEILESMLAEY